MYWQGFSVGLKPAVLKGILKAWNFAESKVQRWVEIDCLDGNLMGTVLSWGWCVGYYTYCLEDDLLDTLPGVMHRLDLGSLRCRDQTMWLLLLSSTDHTGVRERGERGKGEFAKIATLRGLSQSWGCMFSLLDLWMSFIYTFLPISCALLPHLKGGFGCALYCASS